MIEEYREWSTQICMSISLMKSLHQNTETFMAGLSVQKEGGGRE